MDKINNTSDISELREIAWLVNQEEEAYTCPEFSEIAYHMEAKLNEMANLYLANLRSVIRIMQSTR